MLGFYIDAYNAFLYACVKGAAESCRLQLQVLSTCMCACIRVSLPPTFPTPLSAFAHARAFSLFAQLRPQLQVLLAVFTFSCHARAAGNVLASAPPLLLLMMTAGALGQARARDREHLYHHLAAPAAAFLAVAGAAQLHDMVSHSPLLASAASDVRASASLSRVSLQSQSLPSALSLSHSCAREHNHARGQVAAQAAGFDRMF